MRTRKQSYIEVDYREVEKAICEEFDLKEFSLPCALESSNDTSHTFCVEEKPDQFHQEEFDEWVEDGKQETWIVQVLMQELQVRGKIEVGEYLVNICW